MTSMGRPKSRFKDLPPRMTARVNKAGAVRYYYQAGGKKLPLGADKASALRLWARHEGGGVGTKFPSIKDAYLVHVRKAVSRESFAHYETALNNLEEAFAKFSLEHIEPRHIKDYIRRRSKKGAALFEKRVLSAMFNWAREEGHTTCANPCAGVKFSKSERRAIGPIGKRERYVTDAEFAQVHAKADWLLQDAMDLGLLTGQRPSDLLKMTRHDIHDGALWIVQKKTGAKVGIRIEGELKVVLERILARPRRVQSIYLIAKDDGQRLSYNSLNGRFLKALGDADWQFRDIRAKAASDSPSLARAQGLLGHAVETTTTGYRRNKGVAVPPLK